MQQGDCGGVILPGKPERALKHEWNPKRGGPCEFRYCTGEWVKSVVNCVIDDAPFAEGAMRMCYRMQVVRKDGTRHNVVAKVSKDPMEDRNTYFRDVQAQMCSKMWAAEYNARDVPKQIDFVPAYVYELVDRPGRPLVGVEEFVEGVFQKHNNNVGGTVVDGVSEARATPNAFSHFTWEASNNSILVCDIQGVEDFYTDPQIHTVSGKGFGRGNLGQAGLTAFMTRHRCTHVCEFLGLKRTNNQSGGGWEDDEAASRRLVVTGTPLAKQRSTSNEDMVSMADRMASNMRINDTSAPPCSPDASPRGRDVAVASPTPLLSKAPTNRSESSLTKMLSATSPQAKTSGGSADNSDLPAELDHHDDALMDAILDELDDI